MTDGNDSKVLLRSRDGRMLAGVYAGFARYLGLDVTLARVIWAGGLRPERRRGRAGLPGDGGAHPG
jgi:PspC domain-containing protein